MHGIARHRERPGERKAGADGIAREHRADLLHRLVEINLNHFALIRQRGDVVRQEARRVVLKLLQKESLRRDAPERLTVGRARNPDGDGQLAPGAGNHARTYDKSSARRTARPPIGARARKQAAPSHDRTRARTQSGRRQRSR